MSAYRELTMRLMEQAAVRWTQAPTLTESKTWGRVLRLLEDELASMPEVQREAA